VDDAVRVYRWLIEQGSDASGLILAGDSAGAGLALSTLIALRDQRLPMPRAAVLMSTWTDLTASSSSMDTLREVDIQVTREDLQRAGRVYIGDGDPTDPRASTLFADLSGLPPLLMQVGGHEVLLDDSRIFAERARAAGVDATLRIHDGMWHVFQFEAPQIPEAQTAMDEIAAFIRAQFGG
jgi:acetyl esterase/lipase